MNKQTIKKFTVAKAMAYFEGAWHTCSHGECKKRLTCTGGPRGTCTKTVGRPHCAAGVSALLMDIGLDPRDKPEEDGSGGARVFDTTRR